jgi:hypothetical protein
MGVLRGVVKQGGLPVAGAVVQATPVHRGPSTFDPSTVTGVDGSYRLDLPAGDYLVHFDGGAAYNAEWYRDAAAMWAATPLTIGAVASLTANATLGKAASPLSLSVPKPITLQGGATTIATVTGTGFKARGVSGVAFFAGPGVGVVVRQVISDTRVEVDVTAAPGAVAGPRDLTVTRDDGGAATCASCVVVSASASGPTIASVTPASVAPGFVGGLDVRGTALSGATSAAVSGTGVTVKSIAVVSATKVHLRVAVTAGAAPGPRTITVTLAGGQQATGMLTIG